MTQFLIANAPCSWGALEFEGLQGEQIAASQMLDELRDSGYTGTELGDWGYMPTEPGALREELERRGLAMVGAFVPVALKHPGAHAVGTEHALRVARLLAAAADAAPASPRPLIVLADDNGSDPQRTLNAGRVTLEMGLSREEWEVYARGAEQVARAVREETGLRSAFHHHCAGYVETPEEIDRFLDATDPDLLGLVFDTGHYLFGSGGMDSSVVLDGLKRYKERIRHVHFKDCDLSLARRSREERWDYFTSLRHGIFCELGKGGVPFSSVAGELAAWDYHGWIVVEQDILPGMGSPKASAQRNRDYLRAIGL
jgi:inosose dehydratase